MKALKNTIFFIFTLTFFWSCNDEEFEPATVTYLGDREAVLLEGSDQFVTVTLFTSRILDAPGTVTIDLQREGVQTIPAAVDNILTLTIPEGESTVEFNISYGEDDLGESLSIPITITGVSGSLRSIGQSVFLLDVIDNDNTVFEQHFDAVCSNLGATLEEEGWTVYSVASTYNWRCSGSGRGASGVAEDYAYEMNNFGSPDGVGANDWLITPPLTFNGEASLTFNNVKRYEGSTVRLLYSSDYVAGENPADYTWNSIDDVTWDSNTGSWDFVSSGLVDLSGITGKNYLAWQVTSLGTSSGQSSTVRVDDIVINGVLPAIPGGGGGGTTDAFDFPFSANFDDCTENFVTPANFIEAFVAGSKTDRGWGCNSGGVEGTRAVRASAFGGSAGTDNAWLITELPIDMSSASQVYINFMVTSTFAGPGTLHLKWSTDYSGSGDPSSATWTEVDISGQLPVAGSNEYVQISQQVPALVGEIAYVALQYEGGTNTSSASWVIDNFEVTNTAATTGGGGSEVFTLPFTDNFESCATAGQFNIPSNWVEKVVPGSKTDRGWGCREEGVTGWAVRASAFGGSAGTDNAWMISMNPFDLTNVSTATLSFFIKSIHDGAGEVKVLYSTNYAGQDDPTQATWTELTDVASQLPAKGTGTFTEVTTDLTGAVGNEVYIAFQWVGGANDDSGSYTIDDLTVSE